MYRHVFVAFFFFNDTATTEIYTLSLHDALPISNPLKGRANDETRMTNVKRMTTPECQISRDDSRIDRKSTRLNSSHLVISYAVFCLKKKKTSERESGQRYLYPQRAAEEHAASEV